MTVEDGTKSTDFSKSNYLKGSDIPEEGVVYTIEDVNTESIGGEPELKLVVYFVERNRGLILNKTNNKRLTSLFDDDPNAWAGKLVRLVIEAVEFPIGTTTMAIRVWPKPVQEPAQPVMQGQAPPMPEYPEAY